MSDPDRMGCFLLGARVHDHVADMEVAVEEMEEAKDDSPLGADAAKWFGDLVRQVRRELDEAESLNCLPDDVRILFQSVEHRSGHPMDRSAMETLHTLSVKLGDPPLLRNLRRAVTSRHGEKAPEP